MNFFNTSMCVFSLNQKINSFYLIFNYLSNLISLGLDQTSNLSCVESNTYLGRPKLIKFDVDSDVELNVWN